MVFIITYNHSTFSCLKDTIPLLHLLRAPYQEDQNLFHEVSIIGFVKSVKFESPLVKKKKDSVDLVKNGDGIPVNTLLALSKQRHNGPIL